jgi:hypothetical protein
MSVDQVSKQWWDPKVVKFDRHEYVTQTVDYLKQEQSYIDKDNLKHLRLYSGRNYGADEYGNIKPAGTQENIGINVTKSVIDTAVSKVTQQEPIVNIITSGGKWKQRTKARNLEKFLAGVFHEEEFHRKAERAIKDCCWAGTGFVKCFFEGGAVRYERVFPGEIVVDEAAAVNCAPRNLFQVKNVPLEQLTAAFPKFKSQILAHAVRLYSTTTGRTTNTVRVYEAWHLPDVAGKDGRHTICIDGCTLLDEDYDEDFFPFVIYRKNELPTGFFGNGVAEDLAPKHEEINYIMQRVQMGIHNNATAWIVKHANDDLPLDHITNEVATILEYTMEPPQVVVHPAIHQQVLDHVKWLNQICYEETGISHFSATSTKPAGIESGVALQKVLDVESTRQGPLQKMVARGAVDAAKITIALGKKHYKSSYSVKWSEKTVVQDVAWGEVNIPADQYLMKTYPVALLPDTPAGKLDAIEKMLQAGMIDPQTGMMLLDFPDVEAFQSLELAAIRNSLWLVDQVVYEGADIKPRVFHNLEMCVKYMQAAAARAQTEGAPPEVLDRCVEWMTDASEMLAASQPEPVPAGGTPPIDPATGQPVDPGMGPAPSMAAPMEGMPPMEPGMLPPPDMDPNAGGMM